MTPTLLALMAISSLAQTAPDPAPVPAEEPSVSETPPIRFDGQVTPQSAHYDLEQLYAANRFQDGLDETRSKIESSPNDADLYWHAARFMFEIAETFDRKDASIDRVAFYEEMLGLANTGLELAPSDPHIRFARGVAAGRLGTTRGVLSSLWSAKGIEQDWLFTANSDFIYASINGAEQLPCDANHALGIFYRLVPDSFIVQVLAGTRGSLTQSEAFLTRANDACPHRIATMKELAVTKICRAGKKNDALRDEGKDLIRAYLKLPAEDEKDRIDHRHGQALLDTPSIACGYSRDGQQDLDTRKLE
jgi:hypothetical protein